MGLMGCWFEWVVVLMKGGGFNGALLWGKSRCAFVISRYVSAISVSFHYESW